MQTVHIDDSCDHSFGSSCIQSLHTWESGDKGK